MRLFAVLSRDGVPPSCAFRPLVVADPPDACSPLTTNVTDAYVIVPVRLVLYRIVGNVR